MSQLPVIQASRPPATMASQLPVIQVSRQLPRRADRREAAGVVTGGCQYPPPYGGRLACTYFFFTRFRVSKTVTPAFRSNDFGRSVLPPGLKQIVSVSPSIL